jgi:fructokinase
MKKSVLAIGELLVDIISTDYVTSLSEVKNFEMHPGGSPANVCANLRWLGIESTLVSCVGTDPLGDFLIERLKKIGLSEKHIYRNSHYPTSIVVVGRSKGTPDFIAYRSADIQIDEIDKTLIEDCSIVHTCAFALSKNPSQHNILDALSLAASRNKIVSIDWNYAPSLWESDGQLVFQKVMSMHPLLKMSMDDIQRFTHLSLSIEEARNFLQKYPVKSVCLTCGKHGVWYRDPSMKDWSFEQVMAVSEVKDTTGAGDAFWSGFLSAWLNEDTLDECVRRGINIAGQKVQKFGPLYL